MTTELVLLLSMFVFIVLGGFLGEGGPRKTFQNSAPRMAARIERDLATGEDFNAKDKERVRWDVPLHKSDDGELK